MAAARTPPDRLPLSTFVPLFVATATAMLGMGILLPILPPYLTTLGASSLAVGVVFAGYAVARGLFGPVVGRVSDQYGRRRLLLVGLGLYAVLPLGYPATRSVLVIGGLWFLQGVASGTVTPIAQSYVGDITPEGREGEIMNLFYVGWFGGIAVGPFIGGYLADHASLAAPFYTMTASALVAFALVALMVPESPAPASDDRSFRESFAAVLGDAQLRGILAYFSSRGFYRWGFNSFFPLFAISVVALTKTQVGLVLSGYMVAGGLLQYPLGRLVDRYHGRQGAFVVVGGLVPALAMLAVPTARSLVALVGLVFVMGTFSAASRAGAVAIRTERGRVHGMGAVTGVFTAAVSAGQVVGPIGFGAVVGVTSLSTAFYLGGVVGLLGAGVAWWYLVHDPPPVPSAASSTAADD